MSHSVEEYAQLLKNLLPPGQAFRRDPGTNMETLLLGLAAELARLEGRADQLTIEVVPSLTTELLSEWENVAGLPDRCSGTLEDTIQGRRAALTAKLSSIGGQSPAYFIEVARQLGYTVAIEEFRPFRAGRSAAGDPLTNGDWAFTWKIEAPETTIIEFRAGASAAGEPLRSWGNGALECKMNQLKPAHTMVIFGYGAIELAEDFNGVDRLFYFSNYILPGSVT